MTEADPGRSGRAMGCALLASLLAHALAVTLVSAVVDRHAFAHDSGPPNRRAPEDEVVTISSAIRFEKRAKFSRPQSAPMPRRVGDRVAAAPKRYRLQIDGKAGALRRSEGHYVPIKAWHAGGLNYYYVSYAFAYADGNFERGMVPWPVHFAPRDDPFAHRDLARFRHTPLPGPPSGYMPPGTLGRALRAFFPALRFEDG